jgi:beta-mannosidase
MPAKLLWPDRVPAQPVGRVGYFFHTSLSPIDHLWHYTGALQGESDQIPGPNGELAVWNGDASRLHVRKAQYHYGWDWGPVLMCVGPWKPVRLESYTVRISEIRTEIAIAQSDATVTIRADLDGTINKALTATITLIHPSGTKQEVTSEVAVGVSVVEGRIKVTNPKLWNPVGQGRQPLYKATVVLSDGATVLSTSEKRIGLRTVRVVQRKLEGESDGGSFYFEVNGASIFAGGTFSY